MFSKKATKIDEIFTDILGHATLDQFQGEDWRYFVKHFYKSWKEFNEQASTFGKEKVCVLIYEDLLMDPIKELKPCIEFLGYELQNEKAECIRDHS